MYCLVHVPVFQNEVLGLQDIFLHFRKTERKSTNECVRCLKVFMNNKVSVQFKRYMYLSHNKT